MLRRLREGRNVFPAMEAQRVLHQMATTAVYDRIFGPKQVPGPVSERGSNKKHTLWHKTSAVDKAQAGMAMAKAWGQMRSCVFGKSEPLYIVDVALVRAKLS